MSDPFDIDPNAPVDLEFIKRTEKELTGLTGDMMKNRQKQAELIQQSIAEGGPGSLGEAMRILMEDANVGIRAVCARFDVKRSILKKMLQDEIPFDPELLTKLSDWLDTIKKVTKA